MPAHLYKLPNGFWSIVDTREYRRSTGQKNKGIAEELLKRYILQKYGLIKEETKSIITVREYYERWIETKREPMVRRSAARDYRQHFTKYVLPEYSDTALQNLSLGTLQTLRDTMLKSISTARTPKILSPKTVRNVLDSTLRAMWRDALAEGIVSHDPFKLLKWPRVQRQRPDPFTAEERDRILAWWAEYDIFYYPWLVTLFHTGMRPSEAAALRWTDLKGESISITKSRTMGAEYAPKTAHSNRIIRVSSTVAAAIERLRPLGLPYIFVNKEGQPINSKKWAQHAHWKETLAKIGVRHRKFYATRHTFITEMIKAGQNPKAIADYCGTSMAMIEADYCGVLELDMSKVNAMPMPEGNFSTEPTMRKELGKGAVAGPGFEPVPVNPLKSVQLSIEDQEIRLFRNRRA